MEIKLSDFTYRPFSSGTQSWVHRGKTRVWEVLCFWNCASQQKLSKLSYVSLSPLKLVVSPKFILPLKNQFLTHEKMLNITHYQRNVNQNHNEVPLHANQDGCYPKVYKQ